jgi:small subunit ribosomal protein S16
MKQMGRKHRHYFRIVAIDGRQPRDGRVIEELGTYDPHGPTSVSTEQVSNKTENQGGRAPAPRSKEQRAADQAARVTLVPARIKYWLSVGAKPSEQVAVILKKYLAAWEQKEAEAAAGPQQIAEQQAPAPAPETQPGA